VIIAHENIIPRGDLGNGFFEFGVAGVYVPIRDAGRVVLRLSLEDLACRQAGGKNSPGALGFNKHLQTLTNSFLNCTDETANILPGIDFEFIGLRKMFYSAYI
jgi:hypothetical protein